MRQLMEISMKTLHWVGGQPENHCSDRTKKRRLLTVHGKGYVLLPCFVLSLTVSMYALIDQFVLCARDLASLQLSL